MFEILNYSVWYAIHVNLIFSVFFGLMFNLKDHKGRTRGPLVVRGPQFQKRCIKRLTDSLSPQSKEIQSLTELRVACTIAGDWGKLTGQPYSLTAICRSQSRNVETVVLKLITKFRNPEHWSWWIYRNYCICFHFTGGAGSVLWSGLHRRAYDWRNAVCGKCTQHYLVVMSKSFNLWSCKSRCSPRMHLVTATADSSWHCTWTAAECRNGRIKVHWQTDTKLN